MLTTEVALMSILTIQLLVVCLSCDIYILFTNIFFFFFQHVDIRENYCSTSFAHLAIFQAIEFKDQPIPKTLGIFVCQTSESKASFTKCSIL